MDIQQAVLTDIFLSFRKKGIEFAMPTQKVYSNEPKDEVDNTSKEGTQPND
jgi:hypothetical protein